MDPAMARQLSMAFQEEARKLQAVQEKIAQLRVPAAKLMGQLNENEMVKRELELLDDEAAVYKASGPVLVKQDLAEARQNVGARIKYLHGELARVEKDIADAGDARDKTQAKLAEMSAYFQKMQQQAQQQAAEKAKGGK